MASAKQTTRRRTSEVLACKLCARMRERKLLFAAGRRVAPRALLAASVLSASVASADPAPSIDARRFQPAADPGATLYLEPTSTQGAGNFHTAGWLSYAYRPLVLRRDGGTVATVVSHQASLDATFGLGLGKRGQIGLAIPMILAQSGDDNAETRAALGGAIAPRAIGDIALSGKANLIRMGELGGFGLAALGRVTAPTGDRTSTIGEGAPTTEVRLLAEMRFVAAGVQASAGFKLRAEDRTFGSRTWGDEIPWAIGLVLRPQMLGFDDKGKWTWGAEAHGWLPSGPSAPLTSASQSPTYAGLTARYAMRDASLLMGVESGVVRAVGAAPIRAVIAISWAPREHDQDHDGIDDDHDECVGLAEDRDGFEDEDGCPELDNDEDGILDADDKCPNDPEDEDGFEDEDGCPDPDNDKDGILDKEDACPNVAGPPSADPKRNGCPNRDQDGDGVMDDKDKCPTQAEDKDGFEDEDGCPDPDNDGDGIMDAEDACPNEKGPPSSDPKQNGCPSSDRDGDAIPNDVDKCPDEAETYNGVEDEDGCPETTTKPRDLPLATVVEKKGARSLALRAPLRFTKKDGAELDVASLASLRAVAQLLVKHPRWHVDVAVRPSPGAEDLARSRAAAIVEAVRRGTGREGSAQTIGWVKGKMAPAADVAGVSLALVAPEEAPPPPTGAK